MRALLARPFTLGILLGLVLSLAPIATLAVAGGLGNWLQGGSVYGLMPVFVVGGVVAFILTRFLRPRLARLGVRPLHLTHGILLAGWLVGMALMWAALADLSMLRRVSASLSGGVLVVGFWLWIGSLLGHAERSPQSGLHPQTENISSRPR